MKTYAIYDYLIYDNGIFLPEQSVIPPLRINPKKDLTIRPFEEVLLRPNGEINEIIYWDSTEKNSKLYKEDITYQRDQSGVKTKGLAISQSKKISWYFSTVNEQQELDEQHTKTLIKSYVYG